MKVYLPDKTLIRFESVFLSHGDNESKYYMHFVGIASAMLLSVVLSIFLEVINHITKGVASRKPSRFGFFYELVQSSNIMDYCH